MNWLRVVFLTSTILGALVFVASFGVEAQFSGRAKLIQRVQLDPVAASLFGDEAGGTPIGSPQRSIIDDPKAFLSGPDENGVWPVSENYLTEHRIYPLQLQTVRFFGRHTRLGAALAFVISLGLLAWLRKARASSRTPKVPCG